MGLYEMTNFDNNVVTILLSVFAAPTCRLYSISFSSL